MDKWNLIEIAREVCYLNDLLDDINTKKDCVKMASTGDDLLPSCLNDPNFAVICAFLQKFATKLNIVYPNFNDLQKMIENTDEGLFCYRISNFVLVFCLWMYTVKKMAN